MNNFKNGYITLISVMIVAAVIVGVNLSVSNLGIDSLEGSRDIEMSKETRALATGCAEYVLEALKDDKTIIANDEELSWNESSTCVYTITHTDSTHKTIDLNVTSEDGLYQAGLSVDVLIEQREELTDDEPPEEEIYEKITITEWNEV